MKTLPLGKDILIITAHPDDESYLCAGTIAQNRDLGGTTSLVCATLGEQGKSHLAKVVTNRELKQIRKKELIQVSKFLKIDNLILLNLPDGKLERYADIFLLKVLRIARKLRPDYLLSFGPDGFTNHRDHIAAFSATRQVASAMKLPQACICLPPKILRFGLPFLLKKRKNNVYTDIVSFQSCNCLVKIDQKVKKKALLYHKSQIDKGDPFATFPSHLKKEFYKAEYYYFEG